MTDQVVALAGAKAVLFLDFDGVLHPYPGRADQMFCRLALLQDWLRRRPGVDVVISSDWREVHSVDALAAHFDEDLRSRVLGVTPQFTGDSWERSDGGPWPAAHVRHTEVLRWLDERGESRPWLALDDQAVLFRPGTYQLVLCDGKAGLTRDVINHLDIVLGLAQRSGEPFLSGRAKLLAHLRELLQASGDEQHSGKFDVEAWLDEWLVEPQPDLDGGRPGELIVTAGGVERVIGLLGRMFGGLPG
jgi:hypothetical protein